MRLTREQIEKINAKCGQGFVLNKGRAMRYGEKVLEKKIDVDSDTYIEIALKYRENANSNTPMASVTKWHRYPGHDFYMHDLNDCTFTVIGEPMKKKMFSVLQKLSFTVDVPALVAEV